ncbi:hypothetical protein L7F22_069137 [Adiantum nelumboides]|nr:hypothetical protein [Adiantum nelumboides]
MTSSVTRLIIHLTKLGGQAGPCPTIPEAILEKCKAKYLPLKTRKGVARASEEVVPLDCDLSDSGDDASPAASVASGVAASSGGGSSSSSKKKASSQGGRPPKQAKQGTLAQVDVLEDTPKRDDIVYLVKKRWEWMKRPIHGFAALLHPAYKKPFLFSNQVLNEERMKYLSKVLKEELHGEFLQEVINYGDQRGTAFASAVCWKRESLVKPLFWWESFGYQMPHVQQVALRVLGQVVVRGSATRGRGSSTSAVRGRGRASTRAPTTYVRRGSGSGSSTTATTLENVPLSRSTEPREPEFDDESNVLGEGDYGLSSTHSDPSSDEDDTHHDSDWETDTST